MNTKNISVSLAVIASVFLVTGMVSAATTISTDIATNGTLTVDTTSTLTGVVTLGSNMTVPNGYGLDVVTGGGALNIGTTSATSVIIGSSSAKVGIASTSPYVALGVTGTTTASTGMVIGTCSVNLPAMAASTTAVATCVAVGVKTFDKVFVTPNSLPNYVMFTGASSTDVDTIQVSAFNVGSSTAQIVDPAAATWSWMAIR